MKSLLVLASLFTATLSHAVCDFPGKPLRISREAGTGLTQAQFTTVLDKFQAVYNSEISKHGAHLTLHRLWSNDTVNSDTSTDGDEWIINAYGGLARFPGITPDGYLLVLCHEAGHHLGGFPRISGSWASNEGQSDYYAANKCFPKFSGSSFSIPSIVSEKCQLQHADSNSIRKCEQASMAGLNLAGILNKLNGGMESINFNTPDPHKVTRTNNEHPEAQCRLDTYFNGASCGASSDVDFSTTDPKGGACSEEAGQQVGVRPRCWYAPKNWR